MKTHDAKWDDIVFENRNKAYGAYAIRQSYSSHVTEAIFGSLILMALVLLYPQIARLWGGEKTIFSIAGPTSPVIDLTRVPIVQVNPKPRAKETAKVKPKSLAHIQLTQQPVADVEFEVKPPEITSPTSEPGTVPGELTGETKTTGIESATVAVKARPGTIAQFMPAYEGGMQAMSKFITRHLKYPRHQDAEGKVYVEFVVDEEGKVVDVKVVRGIGHEYDKEAARVVAMMPNWKPGRNGDQAVPVRMVLPINFLLSQ